MMGEIAPHSDIETEDPHRQPPHRARHPVAIKIELRPRRGANVGARIHFHPVDDGQEVVLLQPEGPHRLREVAGLGGRVAPVERLDAAAPCRQRGEAQVARTGGIGDVVDLAAKSVDREHRLALGLGQDAHRRIERAAGRPGRIESAVRRRRAHGSLERPAAPPCCAAGGTAIPPATPASAARIAPSLVRCTFSLRGIATGDQADDATGHRRDHRHLESQAKIANRCRKALALLEQGRGAVREPMQAAQQLACGEDRAAPGWPRRGRRRQARASSGT